MPRTPDQILHDFDAGARGEADVDMRAVLWEIIDDVQSSYALAINGACGDFMEYSQKTLDEIENTVNSYLANHYGDD